LYRTALEVIESQADIAYQLLVSTVESFSTSVYKDFDPQDSEKLGTRKTMLKKASELGIDETSAKLLAVASHEENPWNKRKFKRFLSDHVSLDELRSEDRLYSRPRVFDPNAADFERTIGNIYDTRSSNLHSGRPFPRRIRIGTGNQIDVRDLTVGSKSYSEIPPVQWFERVVSIAVRKFLRTSPQAAKPFREVGLDDRETGDRK
jgi:hypothetical protein